MLAEPGNYFGKPVAYGTEKSSKGTPHVTIQFNITHTSAGESWAPVVTPFYRTVRLFLSPAAEPYTMKKLEQLGFNGDFGDGMAFSADTMNGVALQCKHEVYEGEQRERWDLAGGGPTEIERASTDIIRQLNAKYRAKVAPATPKPPAKPTATAPKAPAAPPPLPPEQDLAVDPAVIPTEPVHAEPATPCTRAEAWAAFSEHNESSAEEMQRDWAELIKREFPAKAERQLTADDWGQIMAASKVPF
jgi:hypothetical protein